MSDLPFRYQVYITPLVKKNVYGDVVDVTQDIEVSDFVKATRNGGIGSIKQEIDNGDFDVGIFTYSNVTLNVVNSEGKFNTPDDNRSIFGYSRDLAQVRIEFFDKEGNNYISFKGLINDEATTQDYNKKSVKISILSYDSILRKIQVGAGTIATGDTFKEAMIKILNRVEVLSILNFDENNVNPTINLEIDDGSFFDNLTARDALNNILLASNSILFIDDTDNIIVKERVEDDSTQWEVFNEGNINGKENTVSIKNYNTGLQRTFNSIKVNDHFSNNEEFIETFNLKQKEYTFDFISTLSKEVIIADTILNEFEYPRIELEIEVPTLDFKEIKLLDVVHFDYRSLGKIPEDQDHLPFYAQDRWGQVKYPYEVREFNIPRNAKYKVISITKKPKSLTTILKIRQTGNSISSGYFDFIQDHNYAYLLDSDFKKVQGKI